MAKPKDENIAESEDVLFDFFDFFDKSADDVYSYIMQRIGDSAKAEDVLVDVYFSILNRRRFFWWRNVMQLSTVMTLADKATAKLQRVDDHQNDEDVEEFLQHAEVVKLSKSKKAQMRTALLQRYREAEMNALQYVRPAAAVVTAAVGCFVVVSTAFVEPISSRGPARQIAAAQVLLMGNALEIEDHIVGAQNDISVIAAHFGEQDFARISVDLAPLALHEQLQKEQEIQMILRRFGNTTPFLSWWLRSSPSLRLDVSTVYAAR